MPLAKAPHRKRAIAIVRGSSEGELFWIQGLASVAASV